MSYWGQNKCKQNILVLFFKCKSKSTSFQVHLVLQCHGPWLPQGPTFRWLVAGWGSLPMFTWSSGFVRSEWGCHLNFPIILLISKSECNFWGKWVKCKEKTWPITLHGKKGHYFALFGWIQIQILANTSKYMRET